MRCARCSRRRRSLFAGPLALLLGATACSRRDAADASPEPTAHPEAPDEPALAFTSRTVELATPFGGTDSREVRLTGRLAGAARLELDAVVPPGPEVAVVPAEPGKPQGVRLTLTGTRVGQEAGQVLVKTGLSEPTSLTLLYSWRVTGNLTVTPTNPFIDLRGPGSLGVDVQIASRRDDFRLESAVVVRGPFVASFDPAPSAGVYTAHVGVDRSWDGGQRGAVGTLRVTSNDPAEPARDVPLFALGALGGETPPRPPSPARGASQGTR